VLRLGVLRELRRVGRQKRERRFVIAAVLGEVEVDTTDEMPRRVLPLERSWTDTFDSASSDRNAAAI
jgi:hypothetical protein